MKKGIEILVVLVLAVMVIGTVAAFQYGTTETIENVYIEDRERIQDGESSKYLIFTEDEVFQNTDTIFFLKYNSTDVYRDLEPGNTCDLTVNMFRFGFLSWYRNIIDYNCA